MSRFFMMPHGERPGLVSKRRVEVDKENVFLLSDIGPVMASLFYFEYRLSIIISWLK